MHKVYGHITIVSERLTIIEAGNTVDYVLLRKSIDYMQAAQLPCSG